MIGNSNPKLISIRQAAALGIERVCKPIWSNPLDHIKIDIIDGSVGPWVHLFSPSNAAINGRDPVDLLWIATPDFVSIDSECFVAYEGPAPDSDAYKANAILHPDRTGDSRS